MASLFRRAYAAISRFLGSAADPAVDANAAQIYAKAVSAIQQLFAEDSAALVYQVTPYIGLAKCIMYACDDFVLTTTSNMTSAGTGAAVYTTAVQGHPGIISQSVTSNATPDRTTVTPASNAVNGFIVGGNEVTFDSSCRTVTAQDGTDQWSDRWGISDGTLGADATDGCYFESDRATYGDNNVRLCCANGGVRTKTTMGVAPTANTFERWKLVVNAAGDSVQGYLNDTASGAAVVTNIPTGAAAGVWLGQLIKTLGAANTRIVDRDYFECYQVFSPTTR